jgi:hypothetical protein
MAMTLYGRIENGVVVFDKAIPWPNGTAVLVEVLSNAQLPTLAEQFGDLIGAIDDLPEDMARNHDHYIHGTPKQ